MAVEPTVWPWYPHGLSEPSGRGTHCVAVVPTRLLWPEVNAAVVVLGAVFVVVVDFVVVVVVAGGCCGC